VRDQRNQQRQQGAAVQKEMTGAILDNLSFDEAAGKVAEFKQ
jgi:hypothetical protein